MNISDIFRRDGEHLFWKRLSKDQVVGGPDSDQPIDADQAYFLVRMKEMYLRRIRVLWRKSYPMLHGYTSYSTDKEEHGVAGPGQLKEFGDANLDRVINLNYLLAGPIAYKGGDVSILIGLYSLPGQDAAKGLIDTVSTIASLGGVALGESVKIAEVLKTGVENMLGVNGTKLELGVRDTFYQGNPFRSGYYVGINAPEKDIPLDKLWLKAGRLVRGDDPIASRPYEDFDYFVVEVERRDKRDDWASLPGIVDYENRFAAVLKEANLTRAQRNEKLAPIWNEFTQVLDESPYLTKPDKERISGDVSNNLLDRLKSIETGNPFETRAWGEDRSLASSPADFDFIDVPEDIDIYDRASRQIAQAAFTGNPFTL